MRKVKTFETLYVATARKKKSDSFEKILQNSYFPPKNTL